MFPRHSGETADVPPGVYVLTPEGKLLGRIPIPEDLCTNLAFGGPGRKTLYVTAGKSIYKVPLAVSGYALYPPSEREAGCGAGPMRRLAWLTDLHLNFLDGGRMAAPFSPDPRAR